MSRKPISPKPDWREVSVSTQWRRIDGRKGTCGAIYRLGETQWHVQHCGHPTANFPYVGLRPDGSLIVAPNGMAFRYLRDAQAATQREAGGDFSLANEVAQPKRRKFVSAPPSTQKLIFDGLDCLPGQLDMFEEGGDS